MVFSNNLLMGAAAAASGTVATYVPKGSIWFDGAADYLTKTFSSSALNTKGTYSFWMKRGMQIPATTETFLSIGSGGGPGANTWLNIRFQSGNDMWCNDYTTLRARTTRVFRDPAAWFHLVFRVDTTLVTPSSRFRIYVNGTEVTSYVTENDWSLDDQINLSGNGHPFLIGQWNSSEYFNGRISEFIFLDGYSAPPSDFATEDSNGVWIPKDPTDTVTTNKGTNGFWLDFADSSDLGNDVSGNGHDFTATSMSADNWTYDRPADDSDTKTGNIAVWSPIDIQDSTGYLPNILTNGNRTSTMQGTVTANWGNGNLLTIATNSGKWYCEGIVVTRSSGTYGTNYPTLGLCDGGQDSQGGNIRGAIVYAGTGTGSVQGSGAATYLPSGNPNGTKIQFAIDHENGAFYVGQNGTWGNSATTAEIEGGTTTNALANTGGTGNALGAWSALTDGTYLALGVGTFQSEFTIWVTEDEWDYTPPSGFKSIGTQNLPQVTVTKPSDNFLPMLYEGNGKSQRVGNFIPFTDSHTVNYSARFDSGGSDYLHMTPGSAASSSTIWTFSTWFKRGKLAGDYHFLGAGTDTSNYEALSLGSSGNLVWITKTSGSITGRYDTNLAMQATGNWYNLVISRSGATITISINGVVQTGFSTSTAPGASDTAYFGRQSMVQAVGARYVGSADNYWDGYFSETVFIDGTAYAASSFGQTDTSTNRWIPKDVSGLTFGNNGYYLNYADGNDLGDDESGEGNDFTESGLDTTNSSNQMYDTPTRNYNVMNGAFQGASWATALAAGLTQGNLKYTQPSGDVAGSAFMGAGSGKWYVEIVMDTVVASNSNMSFGIVDLNNLIANQNFATGTNSFAYRNYTGSSTSDTTGQKMIRGTATTAGTGYGAGDVLGIAIDFDAGKIWMGKNNTWYNDADGTAGNPSAGTYPFMDGIGPSGPQPAKWAISLYFNNPHSATFNFGQWRYFDGAATTLSTDAGGYFKYTPPTGFKAFQQDNLSENTAGITGFSWIKNRDAADNHILQDRVRGIYEYIISNDSDDEATNTQSVQRFLQQGVQVGSMDAVNTSAESYVLWNWVANGTSNPSVNTDAGFSIATYTGNGTGGRTVTHSLGVAPEFICVKKLGNGDDSTNRHWGVYHVSEGNTKYGLLSDSNAFGTSSGYWNNTTPGTSTFTVGTDDSVNGNNAPYVAYCWASVPGYSHFGHYDGNGETDGILAPYIYLGFKPSWVMIKRTDTANNWGILDDKRNSYNPVELVLYADLDQTEAGSGNQYVDFTSNGFKIRNDSTANWINADGGKYIYAAFAENPFGGSGIAQAKAR